MNSGSAYIFHYDGTGWIEQKKLMASDAAPGPIRCHHQASKRPMG